MKCPKCDHLNPADAKFCNECGQKLETACPNCEILNIPGSKFCKECGHSLLELSAPTPRELTFEEKLDKIQRYLPKDLTEKILSQRGKIEGERKQVTVMFCDLESFTPMVEKIGADEAYIIMDQVYEILIHCVRDFEGTVNEMTGDGIMALFGAPIALEDAPQRAIRSALSVQREMTRFNDRLQAEKKEIPPLRIRIGIHSGPVVVGTLGNDLRVEFKAVGDTVNLAKRMEQSAAPGTIYITDDSFYLIEGLFRCEALGAKKIKGKAEPVRVYQVITTSSQRTRFDVNAERGLTPLVGRERELDILLDAFEMVKSGRGQAFSIIAEAGGGKSRLLYEFRKVIANEEHSIQEGKCLSYARNVAYHPIIDILKSNFRILDTDENDGIKRKVADGLQVLGVDETSSLPYLLYLLSVEENGLSQPNMSPDLLNQRIIEALQRVVIKGSDLNPSIMIIEDLHWIDSSTEVLLRGLLEGIPGSRIMLLFTYRPEYLHNWGAKSYHSQLTLNRFSNRESLVMLRHLLETEEIEQDLEELVLAKTEGIPFYIEEYVKSLKDLEAIEKKEKFSLVKNIQHITIPSSIQDVILARVDALPEDTKAVLQTGSVIEREFSFMMIKQITELPEKELLSKLSILKDSELIYERGIYPESTYVFKHALTQEVVYDSILNKRKRDLHEKVGATLEEVHKENRDEYFEIIAEHYTNSSNYEKGAEYSEMAAMKASRSGDIPPAIFFARRGVDCVEKLTGLDDYQEKIIRARLSLGMYCTYPHFIFEAEKAIEPIVNLVHEEKHRDLLPYVYYILGLSSWLLGKDTEALNYLNELLRISEEMNTMMVALVKYRLSIVYQANCEFEKALTYIEEAIEGMPMQTSLFAFKSTMARILCHQGKIDEALKVTNENLKLAPEYAVIHKGISFREHGDSCWSKGLFEESEELLLKSYFGLKNTDHIFHHAETTAMLGHLSVEKGDYAKSQAYYNEAISIYDTLHNHKEKISCEISLARIKAQAGQDVNLTEVFEKFESHKTKVSESKRIRDIVIILLHIDEARWSEAEEWLLKAISHDRTYGMKPYLAYDYALYADLYKRQNNLPQAREQMKKAIEITRECGADGWVKRYEKELVEMS